MKLADEKKRSIDHRVPITPEREVVLIGVGGRKDITDDEYNANIYCIDNEGNVIWQIDAPQSPHGRDSFVSVELKNGRLRADRFFGNEYSLDAATGIATETGWHK